MHRLREQLFDQAPSCFNHFTIIMRHKRDLRGSSALRNFLSYWNQRNMISCFEKVFDLIVIRGFIGVHDRSIWKLIAIVL
jgi:hypothetical protein